MYSLNVSLFSQALLVRVYSIQYWQKKQDVLTFFAKISHVQHLGPETISSIPKGHFKGNCVSVRRFLQNHRQVQTYAATVWFLRLIFLCFSSQSCVYALVRFPHRLFVLKYWYTVRSQTEIVRRPFFGLQMSLQISSGATRTAVSHLVTLLAWKTPTRSPPPPDANGCWYNMMSRLVQLSTLGVTVVCRNIMLMLIML